jgi:hypothetical protein
MCIMAILYRAARNTPVLVAANREEYFDRPTVHPKIQSGTPRVICGIDRQAGGTWLGINQHGLFCAVANRRKRFLPAEPRSRGLLCRELLDFRSARDAAQHAAKQLATGMYAGANYVCLDAKHGMVVYGGDELEVVELTPGLHTLSSGDLNDPRDDRHELVRRMLTLHKLDSAVTFLAVASRAFSRGPDSYGRRGVVLSGGEFGTVSSSLVSLPRRIQQAIFQYAPGPPTEVPFEDLSALLRQVLSTDRAQAREKAQARDKAKTREKAQGRDKAKAREKAQGREKQDAKPKKQDAKKPRAKQKVAAPAQKKRSPAQARKRKSKK